MSITEVGLAMSWWENILRGDALAVIIPVVGILVGGAIAVTSMIIKHRERMARIEQGLDPDEPRVK